MTGKKVQCPKCHNIRTVTGTPGEVVKFTCPSCSMSGGVLSPSVVVGVIIVIFIGQYVEIIPMVPLILEISNSVLFVFILGVFITFILMLVSVLTFNRKQF